MSRALLDVNLLIALLDADHADHALAHDWLGGALADGWASCALTQNGFVRILSQPRYPSPVSPTVAAGVLRSACAEPEHEFWAGDVSVLDDRTIDLTRVHGPRQLTDAYLLALAVRRGGRLATFDRSISLSAVRGATPDHLVVL